MRLVPIKNIEQQSVLALHHARQGFVKAREVQANQIRGLLAEFGLIVPKGIAHITTRLPSVIEGTAYELPVPFRHLIERLIEHFKVLDKEVEELEAQIKAWHRGRRDQPPIRKDTGHWPANCKCVSRLDRRCEEL